MPQVPKSVRSAGNLTFADFTIDLRAGKLRRNGLEIPLQEQPFQILALLMERAGEVVSRKELRAHIWSADTFVDFDNGVNTAINKIRAALGDSADQPVFVETLPRRGYRFLAEVHATTSAKLGDRSGSRVNELSACESSAIQSQDAKQSESLAVLPFENASGDTNADYLCDGIAESLINNLSQIRKLRVLSRSTSFRYRGPHTNILRIGKELGVRTVLTGRLFLNAGHLRITAELVDVETDSQLWGQQYSRALSDVLEIQEAIARAIAEKLAHRLTGEEFKPAALKRYTENSEAYQCYLKGQYFFQKWTPRGMQKAFEYFQRAAELDPTYPLPHIGLAHYYNFRFTLEMESAAETIPNSLASATRALELDVGVAEAYAYLAFHKFTYAYDWKGAAEIFQRAAALRPDFVFTHLWRCLFFCALGNIPAALNAGETAIALDPLSPSAQYFLSIPYYLKRDFRAVLQYANKAIELDPEFAWAYWIQGLLYEECGEFHEAIRAHKKAVQTSGGLVRMLCSLGHAYGRAGEITNAQGVLAELEQRAQQNYVSAYAFSNIYLGLRDLDRFFEWLEKAFVERSYWLVYLNTEIQYDVVRSDPRFQNILQRMAFPAPTRS